VENDAERARRERQQRIAAGEERRRQQARGARRYRPGPSGAALGPNMTAPGTVLDDEIEAITRVLEERGPLTREGLFRVLGAQDWGPGRFRVALRQAVVEGQAVRLGHNRFGPAGTGTPT
jgi:hypothetical protein